jgi:hypothetical protein
MLQAVECRYIVRIKIAIGYIKRVLNVIIIQKAYTKSSVGQHGPPTKARIGPGAMEE